MKTKSKLLKVMLIAVTLLLVTGCAAQVGLKGPKLSVDGIDFQSTGKLGPQNMLGDK